MAGCGAGGECRSGGVRGAAGCVDADRRRRAVGAYPDVRSRIRPATRRSGSPSGPGHRGCGQRRARPGRAPTHPPPETPAPRRRPPAAAAGLPPPSGGGGGGGGGRRPPPPGGGHPQTAWSRADGNRVHIDHAVAQPARGRRLQVQPAERRAGRHDITSWIEDEANRLLERGLTDVRRLPYEEAAASRHARPRLRRRLRRRPPERRSTSTPSARPACGSAPTRWAAPARRTSRRSPSATASTSRWSTTRSTRPSASSRSTTTARSAWTARRRT